MELNLILNISAFIWFLVCFKGYNHFAIHKANKTPCLSNVLHAYRADWMRQILFREVRVADMAAIANLERSVAFFASTTMLILAGLLTLLGATERAIQTLSDLPFSIPASKHEWEVKLLVLMAVFVYAFFKFTWSLRQYGFVSVLVGSAPLKCDETSELECNAFVNRSAKMSSMAANNFNYGLRSYYFGLAALAWFVHPIAFMACSAGVVFILYQREFKSSTLRELMFSAAEWDATTKNDPRP